MGLRYKLECSVCDKEIWSYDDVLKQYVKNHNYREVDVRMSDGSAMTSGVCQEHTHPTEHQLQEMTIKTHFGWEEEASLGVGDEEWIRNKGLQLMIVGIA